MPGSEMLEAREFAFTTADFQRIRTLLHQHVGISLSPAKVELVYSRVSRRLRATGQASFGAYLESLSPGVGEWEQFVNALTTNLTAFYREAHHFERLARLLPTMSRPATIWCAASSTGEEPYSLAMTAVETFDSWQPPVRIIATDIDTNVLATARAGVYPFESVRTLNRQRLQRFYLRGKNSHDGKVRVRTELQALVDFRPLNLLAPEWSVKGPLAAIFCRNVLIYFDRETQHRLLQRFAPMLAQGGRLFLGHSETIPLGRLPFINEGQTVYALAPAPEQSA